MTRPRHLLSFTSVTLPGILGALAYHHTPAGTASQGPSGCAVKRQEAVAQRRPESIDARIKRLELAGMPACNRLVPTIVSLADETGVPADILALTTLVESAGKGGIRYEPGFQKRYVDPLFSSITQ